MNWKKVGVNWRRIATTVGVLALAGLFGAALLMTVNLVRYEHAAHCAPGPSRDCIHVSTGTITSPSRQVDSSWCGTGPAGGCHDRTDHSIVVTPAGATHAVELWDTQEHADLVLGTTVTLESWHGQYIAVTAGDHRIEVNGWNPRLLETLLALVAATALTAALLWHFKAMSFTPQAPGSSAKVRSAVGTVVLIVGGALSILLLYVAIPESSPLLYLR